MSPSRSLTNALRSLAPLVVLLGLVLPILAAPGLRGLRLAEALESLRREGLPLVYSSDLVPPDLRVTREPTGATPRERLVNLLAPFGLVAEDAPGGLILVRRRPAVLEGAVVSRDGDAPVAGARVTILDTGDSVTTDEEGRFRVQAPATSELRVLVTAAGFLARELRLPGLARAGVRRVEIQLLRIPRYRGEITVHPGILDEETATTHPTRSVRPEELRALPALAPDVLRTLPQLPGITAPDNSSRVLLHGAEPRDVTYLLDGMELFAPYHMAGFQAPFSVVDAGLARRVRVLTHPLGAAHGDRLGGVIDIVTRQPGNVTAVRVSSGTLESSATVEGPLPGVNGTCLVSARRWYPGEWIDAVDAGVDGLEPVLFDGFAKLTITPRRGTVLFLEALSGRDRVRFGPQEPIDRVSAQSRSRYVWGGWLAALGPRTSLRTVVYAARWHRRREGATGIAESEQAAEVDDRRATGTWGLRQEVRLASRSGGSLRAGWEFRRMHTRFDYRRAARPPDGAPVDLLVRRLAPSDRSVAFFTDAVIPLRDGVELSGGLRWQSHALLGESWIDPRLALRWSPASGSLVTFSAGIVHQSERTYELQIEDGVTTFHPAQRAQRLSLAFERTIGRRTRARIELYRDRLASLRPRFENLFNPIDLLPEAQPDRVRLAPSQARLQGMELSLAWSDPGRPWSGWIALSRARAVDRLESRWVPRAWDEPWALVTHVRYDHGAFRFSASATVRTGWPRTPLAVDGATGGTPVLVSGPLRSARFDHYARLDLSIQRTVHIGGGEFRAEVGLLDALGRGNECCYGDVAPEPLPGGRFAPPGIDTWRGRSLVVRLGWSPRGRRAAPVSATGG